MRQRLFALLFFLLALGCFGAAGRLLLPRLKSIESAHHLSIETPDGSLPLHIRLINTALGNFRGLLVDCLWLRLSALQEDHKYQELVQLSRMITVLEPRLDRIWGHLAWNLAYNISVDMPVGEQRWQWVWQGVRLLQKGISYNPRSVMLHKELAWIFSHKIGSFLDDSHLYYKHRYAGIIEELLGFDQALSLQEAAAACPSWSDVGATPGVADSLRALEEAGVRLEPHVESAAQFLAWYRGKRSCPKNVQDVLNKSEFESAYKVLASYLTNLVLREEHGMHPDRMLALQQDFGKLDWRIPDVIALYWANESLRIGRESGINDIEWVNSMRIVNTALNSLLSSGTIFEYTDAEGKRMFYRGPDYSKADMIEKSMRENIREIEKEKGTDMMGGFQTRHKNFISSMVLAMYLDGRKSDSLRYWKILRDLYPSEAGFLYEDYLRKRANDFRDATYEDVRGIIANLVGKALFYQVLGQDDQVESTLAWAEQVRVIYLQNSSGAADSRDRGELQRPVLAWRDLIVEMTLRGMNQSFPPQFRDALARMYPAIQDKIASEKKAPE